MLQLHRLAVVIGSLLIAGLAAPTVQAANFNPPKHYYLALGDSNAFGAQLGKFFQELSTGTYDPASFNTGYVDDFATRMRTIDPQLETVNLSCPAESTSTFLGEGPITSACAAHQLLGIPGVSCAGVPSGAPRAGQPPHD